MNPERLRVLIVEDQAVVALDIEQHLRRLGYGVAGSFRSAEDALAKLADLDPDLVLMDIRLRGVMTGIEAAKQILEDRQVPVVYLTAHADAETLKEVEATSPYGYIVKPFEEETLRATLAVAFEQHHRSLKKDELQEDLLSVLDSLPIGTVLAGPRGSISFTNATARHLLGLSEDSTPSDWRRHLGFSAEAQASIRGQMKLKPERREEISVRQPSPRAPMKVQVVDDPRGNGDYLFTMVDASEVTALREKLDQAEVFEEMIGGSVSMQRVFKLIDQVSVVDSSVMILGETGTGKELVARAIHRRSPRAEGSFVAVNCGGLSEELAASQLFGHRKGAFTGADDDRVGYFEAADGGTLLLDEVGELSDRVQTNLLRVLEEREVARIGDTQTRPVDVRLLVATNRDLTRQVENGDFRADLFYRIRVARIELPTLRERRLDIPALVARFLEHARQITRKQIEGIDRQAMRHLLGYDWPGNVRELKNAVEFSAIRAQGPQIREEDLPPEVVSGPSTGLKLESEEDRIRSALRHSNGNRKGAAELLGISRATLYRRLASFGID